MGVEEVDKTILPILQDVGCNFGGKDSISEFGTEEIVQAVSRALNVIDQKYKFPIKLPQGNAARFRICTGLSKAIEELGYTGENGYQAFLYPNESDMRKLLIWMVDKLPKTSVEEAEEVQGPEAQFRRNLLGSLRTWKAEPYNEFGTGRPAPTSRSHGFRTVPLAVPGEANTEAIKGYHATHLRFAHQQPWAPEDFTPSILEAESSSITTEKDKELDWEVGDVEERRKKRRERLTGIVSEAFRLAATDGAGKSLADMVGDMLDQYESRMGRKMEFEVEKDEAHAQVVDQGTVTNVTDDGVVEEDEDAVRQKMEAELAAIQAQISKIEGQLAEFTSGATNAVAQAQVLESDLGQVLDSTKKLEQAYKVKKRTLDLLPNAEENLAKLQQIAEQSAARLVKLGEEWESHRVPIIAKYRRRRQLVRDRKEEARSKLEKIKSMRAEQKQMAVDVRAADAKHKRVLEELSKLPKSINRQVYVRRIMDIVKNLNKQKADIKKILVDVRTVQKDINMISETSNRSFAVTDEIIFRAAQKKLPNGRKDAASATAYKQLVTLRKEFSRLVSRVEDIGRAKNEIRDLSSRIDALEQRNTGLNTKRIKGDLAAVKKENAELTKRIKAAKKARE